MRKVIFIAMAALTLLTAQCKKNEPKPEEKAMVPITGNVDFGGSKTAITTAGYITPVDGDKIYIYHEGNYAGYMRCTPTTGQQFECSGVIEEDCLGKTCTFMYLGTGSTEADGTTGICETSTTISFADQTSVSVSDGKISGLDKFHVGSCIAEVSSEGTVTLPMVSKMAIAYFQLTDGTNPIANKDVTISGVSATANIDMENGTISGNGTGNITVHTGENGCFYMALVPQSGEVTFNFSGPGDGTTTFPNGIRECSFYSEHGSGNPLQVKVTPSMPSFLSGKFTVSDGVEVQFSRGNLYWDGSAFKFETNQWSFANSWNASYVSHFYWSKTASVAYAEDYSDDGALTSDVFFTNASGFQVNGEAGWRTLSNDEWNYLLGYDPELWAQSVDCGRPNAMSLCAWKDLGGGVKGLVILPDDADASVMSSITSTADLETYSAVFLPAAGHHMSSGMDFVGSYCLYWSGTIDEENEEVEGAAYRMQFISDGACVYSDDRNYGYAVRLVR